MEGFPFDAVINGDGQVVKQKTMGENTEYFTRCGDWAARR